MKKHYILVLIIYTLLTLLVFNHCISENRICGHGIDTYGFIWIIWWFNKAITQLKINPYYTDYIFYPIGTSLAYNTVTPFNSLLGIVLQRFFDLYTSYNILFLLSFIIAGIGGYLLSYYFTKNSVGSFFAGIIYSFSPYHMLWGGILNIATIQWIPFYVLFLFKTFYEKRKSNAIICGLFLFLVSISSWYYMVFSFIFLAIFLLYLSIFKIEKLLSYDFIKKMIIMIVVFTILVLPFVFPMFDLWSKTNEVPGAETSMFIKEASFWSQDLASFLIPPEENIFLSRIPIFRNVYKIYNRDPYFHLFIGYSACFMIFFYLVILFKNRLSKKDKTISFFWLIFLIISFFIILGPTIRVFERPLINLTIIWKLISYYQPASFFLKTPYIFDVMLTLCISVLFAYGVKYLFNIFKNKNHQIVIILILIILMGSDYYIQGSVTFIEKPEFFVKISEGDRDYKILEVPALFNPSLGAQGTQKSMYYQTIHEKKIIFGHVSILTSEVYDFLYKKYRFINLILLGNEITDSEITDYTNEFCNFIKENNIRYLVFEKSYEMNFKFHENFYDIFNEILKIRNITGDLKVFEDEQILVFDLQDLISEV